MTNSPLARTLGQPTANKPSAACVPRIRQKQDQAASPGLNLEDTPLSAWAPITEFFHGMLCVQGTDHRSLITAGRKINGSAGKQT